ncbi:MAG TPA: PVC-type heme-binding CxxCH protein [Planctomicrobium sp.]|nr:PVC-type heme-binding CxxCH protein [Planctomicrobium sp.]
MLLAIGLLVSVPRHADAEESKPLEPADTLKMFELEEGLVIELVASEPQVIDPVAISFDHLGRMYVAEYRDYPLGPGEGKEPLSQIKLLEDLDGDGVYEKATLFAKVPWAQGVLAYGKGVIVTASPQVLYLEDTDGDGQADKKEVLLDGFTFGNPQLRVGHPRLGLDQRIYLTNGLTGGKVTVGATESATGEPLVMGRNDLVYDPRQKTIDLVPGQAQFGNTFDDFGNRFFCTNRNPIIYAPLSHQTLTRNPLAPAIVAQQDVAPSGGASRVYSLIEAKTTAVSHAGTHTAACGTHVYRGGKLGYADNGDLNVFACEPTGSLVTRTILTPKGTSFTSRRPYERRDFLASRDPWFRPVSLADGPDGNLYLVDMYREVIEHPQYMPEGLAETLRLREGDDRGRIYRIRRTGEAAKQWTPSTGVASLLEGLKDGNGWQRDLSQRLLLEEANAENAESIATGSEAIVTQSNDPRAITKGLWTIVGLQQKGLLTSREEWLNGLIVKLLKHSNPLVVEQALHAARFAGLHIDEFAAFQTPKDSRLALAWIDGLASVSSPNVKAEVGELVSNFLGDYWIRQIALTLPPENAAPLLCKLLQSDAVLNKGGDSERELISFLSTIVGKRADQEELVVVLQTVLAGEQNDLPWWRSSTLFGLEQGLAGGKGLNGKKSLAKLVELKQAPLSELAQSAVQALETGLATLIDSKANPLNRRAAVPSLGRVGLEQATPVLQKLLLSNADSAIQRAAYPLVNNRNPEETLKQFLEIWSDLGPASRALVIEMSLARPKTSMQLMQAMSEGIVSPSMLTIEQRDPLIMSRDPNINGPAKKLFGEGTSKDRAAVIEKYRGALAIAGNVDRGREVFRRACAQCHKIGNEGTLVGPDLSDIRAKGNDVLLTDILDPSRAIEPRWTSYVAATADGRVITGLLVRENDTGIVLRMAKGVEETLLRDDIDALRANEQSLMPAGIEADVTVEQMADLLAFLKSGR